MGIYMICIIVFKFLFNFPESAPCSLSFWLEVPLCDTNDIFFTWTFQMLAIEKHKSTLKSYHVNQESYVLK